MCLKLYVHTYIHASMRPCVHANIHACMHPYIHTYIHTYIHIVYMYCLVWGNPWRGSILLDQKLHVQWYSTGAIKKFSGCKHHEPHTNCMKVKIRPCDQTIFKHIKPYSTYYIMQPYLAIFNHIHPYSTIFSHIQPISCISNLFSGPVLAKVVSSLAITACATQSNCLQAISLFTSLADNLLPHPSKVKYCFSI